MKSFRMAGTIFRTLFFLVVGVWSVQASAYVDAPEVKKVVEENTHQLVEQLNRYRSLYDKDPQAFYEKMEEALSEMVDFRRIAGRVMGRYARHTTVAQRNQFVENFKKSLFSTYAKALVETENFSISVQGSKMVSEDNDRASVELVVTSASGTSYPVIYSMYRNPKTQKWLLENLIVNGVNVGLAYRDRFEEEMARQGGDIDKVIASWNAELTVSSEGQ